MPRMSIDSRFGRDPRVIRLAKACGISRRETMGALLDVWEVSYERIKEHLPEADVDAAAELDGFARKMIECGLARDTKRGVYIAGAKERIAYRKKKKAAGVKGGLKSGESRRNSAKQNRARASSESNPSSSVSAPDTASDPEREDEPPASPRPQLSLVPSVWIPDWVGALADAREHAQLRGVDVESALIAFNAHADSKRWPNSERGARLAAWLARERRVDAARAKPRPRRAEPPPPNCAPLSDEDRAAIEELRQQLATQNNLDAVADAERRREREAG